MLLAEKKIDCCISAFKIYHKIFFKKESKSQSFYSSGYLGLAYIAHLQKNMQVGETLN